MSHGEPTHWLTHDCQYCYKRSKIFMEDAYDTEDRFCPNCGISSELVIEDYDDDHDEWNDEYEE